MDRADAFTVLGGLAIALGLLLIHPAWLLVVVGYSAWAYGLNRSR